ncbi:479_t:CDS:2 [Funneliformis geosporum]|nr:479_t:CDS:2 [Funneliformis geosporum]
MLFLHVVLYTISQNVSHKTTLTNDQSSPTCYLKIINPRPGDRFSPGDEINVKWDLIGLKCRNSTDETNTNITLFTYPVQIILSPNIRHSSLFFLDIELTFTKIPPRLIFDVMGPFTILPLPESQLSNETDTRTDNGQNVQEVKGNLSMASKAIRISWINIIFNYIYTIMNV